MPSLTTLKRGDWIYVESNKYVKIGQVDEISLSNFTLVNVTNWPRISPKPDKFFEEGPNSTAIESCSYFSKGIVSECIVSNSFEECYRIPFEVVDKIYSIVEKAREIERDFVKVV